MADNLQAIRAWHADLLLGKDAAWAPTNVCSKTADLLALVDSLTAAGRELLDVADALPCMDCGDDRRQEYGPTLDRLRAVFGTQS